MTTTRTMRLASEQHGQQIVVLNVRGIETTYYVSEKPGCIQLWRYGSTNVYDVKITSHGLVCDCPDATYKHHKCKHICAVETLQRLGKLTAEKPEPKPDYCADCKQLWPRDCTCSI